MSKPKSDATPLYEGMFLMDPQAVGDLAGSLQFVQQLLDKQSAEVIALRKWDERKLAFPIKGQKRGTYLLALFRMDGKRIPQIERDCELSEEVLRVLITRADHFGDVEIEQTKEAARTTRDETKLRSAGESEGQSEPSGDEAPSPASAPDTEPAATTNEE